MIEITVPISNFQFFDRDGNVLAEGEEAWNAFFDQFYDSLDYYLSQLGDA